MTALWLSLLLMHFGVLMLFMGLSVAGGYAAARLLSVNGIFPPFLRWFVYLLSGNVLINTFYSVWTTQFKTVNCVGLMLLVFFIFELKKQKPVNPPEIPASSSPVLQWLIPVCALIFFLANAFMYLKPDEEFPFYVQSADLVDYAGLTAMLNETGQENYNGLTANALDNSFHGLSPYHFYELWLAAFTAKVFGLQPVAAYWLITYPVFYLLIWLGLLSYCEYYRPVKLKTMFFAFLLLFVGGIYLPFYKWIPLMESVYYLHNNLLLTYGLIEPFLLAALILFLHRQYVLCWLVLLYLPVISVTVLPGVVGGFVLMAMLNFFAGKFYPDGQIFKGKNQLPAKNFIYLFCCLSGLGGIYLFWGTHHATASSVSDFLPVFAFSFFDNKVSGVLFILKKAAVVYGLYVVKSAVAYFPFLFWVLFRKQIFDRRVLMALGCVFFASLSATFLLILHPDATQLFRNISFPLLNLAICCAAIQFFRQLRPLAVLVFGLLIAYQVGFTVYYRCQQVIERQTYSTSYLQSIAAIEPERISNKIGGFIYGQDFYSHDYIFSKMPRHHVPAAYLASMPQFHTVTNLGILEMPLNPDPQKQLLEKRYLANHEFYRFTERQKQQGSFQSVAQIQADFIGRHKMSFLVVGKGVVLPPQLQLMIRKEYKDELSGERFLLLGD